MEDQLRQCLYCDGNGEIEMDNNGPIVSCPICAPPEDSSTPTHKELVEALREAKRGLEEVDRLATKLRKSHAGAGGACATSQQRNYDLYRQATDFKKLTLPTLSKINPVLERLEAQ